MVEIVEINDLGHRTYWVCFSTGTLADMGVNITAMTVHRSRKRMHVCDSTVYRICVEKTRSQPFTDSAAKT